MDGSHGAGKGNVDVRRALDPLADVRMQKDDTMAASDEVLGMGPGHLSAATATVEQHDTDVDKRLLVGRDGGECTRKMVRIPIPRPAVVSEYRRSGAPSDSLSWRWPRPKW